MNLNLPKPLCWKRPSLPVFFALIIACCSNSNARAQTDIKLNLLAGGLHIEQYLDTNFAIELMVAPYDYARLPRAYRAEPTTNNSIITESRNAVSVALSTNFYLPSRSPNPKVQFFGGPYLKYSYADFQYLERQYHTHNDLLGFFGIGHWVPIRREDIIQHHYSAGVTLGVKWKVTERVLLQFHGGYGYRIIDQKVDYTTFKEVDEANHAIIGQGASRETWSRLDTRYGLLVGYRIAR